MDIRRQVAKHPLISKYFHILGADKMVPAEFADGFTTFSTRRRTGPARVDPGGRVLPRSDAHDSGVRYRRLRWHAIQGDAGGRYNIQLNKTSRNSVLLQSNINNTRSDVAHLIRVLVEIARRSTSA